MKLPSSIAFPTVAVLALMLGACDKAPLVSSSSRSEPEVTFKVRDFPIKRKLTDQKGRTLDGSIVAKTESSVYVIRFSDGMNLEVPLDSLGKESRELAESLPELVPPSDFVHGSSGARLDPDDIPASKRQDPPYIKTRLEAIKRLEEQNEVLSSEAASTSNSMLQRTRITQIEKNRQEISTLKAAIERYRIEQSR